jgi:rod shape determining protein RodA
MKPVIWANRLRWSIVAAAAPLVAVGWLGIARCADLFGDSDRFVRQQMVWSGLALLGMLAITVPSYRLLCRWSYAVFVLALVLLAAVYFFPPVNGAHRWIRIGPLGVQPSELAKVAYVLALARYLMYSERHRRFRGLLLPLGLTLVPVMLILREPDLGTAMVFAPVLFAMLLVAGARWGDLVRLALAGLVALPLMWTQMSDEQKSRVTALLEQTGPGETPTEDGYHLHQAKQMLALGGAWGTLITGQSLDDPAAYHLPEARSDFIFCVLGERLGLWGIGLVLGLFTLLAWRGIAVAEATREPFGRLVAAGLVALVAVQVLINTAMTVGLLPITGLSLPLVSYGGTGMVTGGLVLGLLLNIGMRPGYEITSEPFRWAVGGGEL